MSGDIEEMVNAVGFAAGVLVHSRDGPRPIETLAVGDWVLSQPEGTGTREFKRIARVVREESRAIGHVYFWTPNGKDGITDHVLTTARLRVYVGAYRNDGGFSDEYWEEMTKPIGWRRVEWLESHQLVECANGEMSRVGAFHRLWMTHDPGQGWVEANPDSTTGSIIAITDGRVVRDPRRMVDADFAGDDDFNVRNETPELQELWGYKSPIYDLEVEDFHTYYVGERGVWVHDRTRTT
jgi:hypothetical protein